MTTTAAEKKIAEIVRIMRDEMRVYSIKVDEVREIHDSAAIILAWKGFQVSTLNKLYILNACGKWLELTPDFIYAEIIAEGLLTFLQETINDINNHKQNSNAKK